MAIHNTQGGYVYVGRRGASTLVMYRRLVTKYLLVVFRANSPRVMFVSHADILDLIPIKSAMLSGLKLEFRPDLSQTVQGWLEEATRVLLRQNYYIRSVT